MMRLFLFPLLIFLPFTFRMQVTVPPSSNRPTLLASYVIQPRPFYNEAQYTPHSSLPKPYNGWDMLSLPGKTINDGVSTISSIPDWLTLKLNRTASLAIVWRGQLAPPDWLSSWPRSEDATIGGRSYPTYRNVYEAGNVVLGGVNNPGISVSQATYTVLFAEADGTPTPIPHVPDAQAVPVANTTCPAWVHGQYVTMGPDGKSYPTWHPQIDPVYWCYFRHEHGSDPSIFAPDYHPAYGYTAAAHGMMEGHAGFKSYVFDDGVGHRWIVTNHFGTGSIARACTRMHTFDVAAFDKGLNAIQADVHLMGDFGASVVNSTQEPLTPSACPNQATNAAASTATRMIPVATRNSVGYEPWRVDTRDNVLGLVGADFTINTPGGSVICNDVICDQPVTSGNVGVYRFATVYPGFGIYAGSNTGEFYTDAHGKTLMTANQAGAVHQYVAPGVNISTIMDCGDYFTTDPWQMPYACSLVGPIDEDLNLEGALQPAN
ncbi:MAG: hypothetical protein NVSMB42_11820 [Herpetosiphon sp.]